MSTASPAALFSFLPYLTLARDKGVHGRSHIQLGPLHCLGSKICRGQGPVDIEFMPLKTMAHAEMAAQKASSTSAHFVLCDVKLSPTIFE